MARSIFDDIIIKMGEPAVPTIIEALCGLEETLNWDLTHAKKIITGKRISRLVEILGLIGGKEAEAALIARKNYKNEITREKVSAALQKIAADKPASDIVARAGAPPGWQYMAKFRENGTALKR